MRVEGPGWVLEGDAVDCRSRPVSAVTLADAIARPIPRLQTIGPAEGVDAATAPNDGAAGADSELPAVADGVAAATTSEMVTDAGPACELEDGVRVWCPDPGMVHEHVALLAPSSVASFSLRPALAAAARSRGIVADSMSALESARAALAAVDVPDVDLADARERVAAARRDAASVRADVAAARGVVQARDDADAVDTGTDSHSETPRERLADAIATASERETAVVAAEQSLARARRRARAARDARSRRLELEDRVGQLERRVRSELVAAVEPPFLDAIRSLRGVGDSETVSIDAPGGRDRERGIRGREDGGSVDALGGDDGELDALTAAFAVTRVARVDAPVVLATDWFQHPALASEWLDAPIILASRPTDDRSS